LWAVQKAATTEHEGLSWYRGENVLPAFDIETVKMVTDGGTSMARVAANLGIHLLNGRPFSPLSSFFHVEG
jgi:hypothetical protein